MPKNLQRPSSCDSLEKVIKNTDIAINSVKADLEKIKDKKNWEVIYELFFNTENKDALARFLKQDEEKRYCCITHFLASVIDDMRKGVTTATANKIYFNIEEIKGFLEEYVVGNQGIQAENNAKIFSHGCDMVLDEVKDIIKRGELDKDVNKANKKYVCSPIWWMKIKDWFRRTLEIIKNKDYLSLTKNTERKNIVKAIFSKVHDVDSNKKEVEVNEPLQQPSTEHATIR